MPTTDERVAQLEVRVEVQTTVMSEVKGLIVALDQKMDRRLEAVDRRLFSIITIQFATLLAIITAMLGVLTRLL